MSFKIYVLIFLAFLSTSCVNQSNISGKKTINGVSKTWKSYHNLEDFKWLSKNAIKIGDTKKKVISIWGQPFSIALTDNGTSFYTYKFNFI